MPKNADAMDLKLEEVGSTPSGRNAFRVEGAYPSATDFMMQGTVTDGMLRKGMETEFRRGKGGIQRMEVDRKEVEAVEKGVKVTVFTERRLAGWVRVGDELEFWKPVALPDTESVEPRDTPASANPDKQSPGAAANL